jgi:hypothetical protein
MTISPDPTVLILDDDELWLARHERRLDKAGFDTYSTDQSKEAIKALKTNPSIKFALIDEILYVPPIPLSEENRELQSVQGLGVIREINKQRSDVQFIIVTSAPYTRSGGDTQLFRRETAALRRHPGVIDIIHKADITENPETSYDWLVDLLKRSKSSVTAKVVQPRILMGLGFTKEAHEAMAEQMELKRKQYMPIAPLLKTGASTKVLSSFIERAQEKMILLEMPGSKRMDKLSDIRPDSSAFRILSFLAQRTELQGEVIICENDYQHSTRRAKRTQSSTAELHISRSDNDFAFGYDGNSGRIRLNEGVQIEGKSQHKSPLKVAIHRLSKQLQTMNVGPSKRLFNFDSRGYQPNFQLGIVVFAVRTHKSASEGI